jgi:hypothetical protein
MNWLIWLVMFIRFILFLFIMTIGGLFRLVGDFLIDSAKKLMKCTESAFE